MRQKKEPLAPDFLQIPYKLVKDRTVSPMEKMVYGAVYFYSRMRGERCFASNAEIARLLVTTPNTIANSLSSLEEKGYIDRIYSDPGTKARRTEIIPKVCVLKKRTPKTLQNGGLRLTKSLTSTQNSGSSYGEPRLTKWLTSKNGLKSENADQETAENNDILPEVVTCQGSSYDEEREKSIIKKNYVEQSFDPSGLHDSNGSNKNGEQESNRPFRENLPRETVPRETVSHETETPSNGSLVNDAIALFIKLFPGDFIGNRSAFAKKPTRDAVEKLLERYTVPQLKELIRKYDEKKTDKFRPEAGTVYEFCTFKLAKIEAFLVKDGGLWAHRPISSQEWKEENDKQVAALIEKTRKESRERRDKFYAENPEEKDKWLLRSLHNQKIWFDMHPEEREQWLEEHPEQK